MTDTTDRDELVERDLSGETVMGMRVAAWRETHPEHGDTYGHRYSEHWSTPNNRDPRVKIERLFTEDQVRARIQADAATIADLVAALKQTVHLARAYSSGTGSIFEKAMTDAERTADRAALKGGDHG